MIAADRIDLTISPADLDVATIDAVLEGEASDSSSFGVRLERRNARPTRAIQRISALNIDADQARLLQVETRDAGLFLERVSYLPSGRVVELTHTLYRGDVYDFVAELTTPGKRL